MISGLEKYIDLRSITDTTIELNIGSIDPADPYALGDATTMAAIKEDLTHEQYQQLNLQYQKELVNRWVNSEVQVTQAYTYLRQQATDEEIQSYLDIMINEETKHAQIARSFYLTAFDEEPNIELLKFINYPETIGYVTMYLVELHASAALNSMMRLTANQQLGSTVFKKLLADDAGHAKYTQAISQKLKSIEFADTDEKLIIKSEIIKVMNGAGDADFGSYAFFKSNLPEQFNELLPKLKNCPQSKLFQQYYKRQVTKWLKSHGIKHLI